MDPVTVIIMLVGISILLILLSAGMPIAFSLGLSGLAGMAMLEGSGTATRILETLPWDKTASYTLTCVPMFVLMGQAAFTAGIGDRAYFLGDKWLGRIPGGLGIGTMAAGCVFGACSGSTTAAAAVLGRVAVPEMRKHGYDAGLAAAIVATAGLLADLIPPSIAIVIYGSMTGESVGKSLIAGIIPGILSAAVFSVWIYGVGLVHPHRAPRGEKSSWRDKLISLRGILWVAVLFIGVFGGMFAGIFTPTEGGAIGACLSLAILVVMNIGAGVGSIWKKLSEAFIETIHISIMIFTLLVGAAVFSYFLSLCRLPIIIEKTLGSSGLSPIWVLIIICLIYIPLGAFLDPLGTTLITLPVVYPLIIKLGYNGIWFCIIFVKMIEVGCLTPPVGENCIIISSVVPDIPVERVYRNIAPFIMLECVIVAILIAFPDIVLWLPSMMK